MRITVIGAGKVGMEITRRLSEEGHDIIVIDKDERKIEKIQENNLDVIAIKGSGSSTRILKSPELENSDLLVAVTNSDEINMIACMMAKKISIPRTVARIRDPDHARELILFEEDMGIDLVVNPEYAAAMEIGQLLTLSLPVHTELFADGKILLADITIEDSMTALAGKKLKDVALPEGCLIVAISRCGEMVIPSGNDLIMQGDTIYLLGHAININKFCLRIKKKKQKLQDVIILGGGRISYYLAEKLNSIGIRVKIIERDPARCRELAENLPDTLVLQEDGSDIDILKREGIRETDGFITITGIDEENLLLALLAKQMGAKRVAAVVSRPSYTSLVERLGVDAAISPRLNMVKEILRFIRGGRLLSLFLLLNGQAEVFELIVPPGVKSAGKSLKNLALPKGAIIGAILRGEDAIIPKGNDIILENDRLVIFALGHIMHIIESLFSFGGTPFEQKPHR